MAETIETKADRLLKGERVTAVDLPPTYAVQGDSGTYLVVLWHDGMGTTCTCPAEIRCSHIEAAERLHKRED